MILGQKLCDQIQKQEIRPVSCDPCFFGVVVSILAAMAISAKWYNAPIASWLLVAGHMMRFARRWRMARNAGKTLYRNHMLTRAMGCLCGFVRSFLGADTRYWLSRLRWLFPGLLAQWSAPSQIRHRSAQTQLLPLAVAWTA